MAVRLEEMLPSIRRLARDHRSSRGSYDADDLVQAAVESILRSGLSDPSLMIRRARFAMIDFIREMQPGGRMGPRDGVGYYSTDVTPDLHCHDASSLEASDLLARLTRREQVCAIAQAAGYTAVEIGQMEGVSHHRIQQHFAEMRLKLRREVAA